MDYINKNSSNNYTASINSSKYEQTGLNVVINKKIKNTNNKCCYSLLDIFLSNFDPSYVLMDHTDRKNYIKQKGISIASELDEDKINKYDKFNYNSSM